jgi:hypothetical protein
MTEREKEVIEIIKKYPEEILEVFLDLLKKRYKIATKRDIKILYYKIKLKIAQSESNTKLEIENLRAETNERINQLENNTKLEIEKIRAETQYHIAKSESKIIKFILASSIIQTIFIISAVLGIIYFKKL